MAVQPRAELLDEGDVAAAHPGPGRRVAGHRHRLVVQVDPVVPLARHHPRQRVDVGPPAHRVVQQLPIAAASSVSVTVGTTAIPARCSPRRPPAGPRRAGR
ncbi:hypothetical protein O1L55_03850 [Streptomyces albulus]|nr:hypothetical protein [Streptomyces noursei]